MVQRGKCVVMFSGGLDSAMAAHLLKSQGVAVTALHFVLPFVSGLARGHDAVRAAAESIGVPLLINEEGEEFLEVLKNPHFGFGKNVNPCIDCRIHRLRKARAVMDRLGARFLATGEVVGQRPMSQRRVTMGKIEEEAGVKGLLVRPLSALLLPPTIPETEGWIDRERLLNISGRGRSRQLEYARQHSLIHGAPAGGCVLAERNTALRFGDLIAHQPDFNLDDLKLLVYGRRFRLTPELMLAVARESSENPVLLAIANQEADYFIDLASIPGPLGIARGIVTPELLRRCCSIVARFSKARLADSVDVSVRYRGKVHIETVVPATSEQCLPVQIRDY